MDLQGIEAEIQEVNRKLFAIETLRRKPFRQWSDIEIEMYGNHKNLRQEMHDLKQEKLDLKQEKHDLHEEESVKLKLLIPPEKNGNFLGSMIMFQYSSLKMIIKPFKVLLDDDKEVVSKPVTGSLGENPNESLLKYRRNALVLKGHESVLEVCNILLHITSGDYPETGFSDSPFIFLEGSSGSGKSQMAFAIEANLSSERDIYYLLFNTPGSSAQMIYLNFTNISTLFSACYEADKSMNSIDALSPNCNLLFVQSLYVYGLIYKLLSEGLGSNYVKVCPKTGQDVRELLIQKKMEHRRPVFILDECIVITDETVKKVRFVRNCFRSLGMGLVMLGTDSRAAKLPSHIGNSSRSEIPKPWCFVFGRLPEVDLSLIGLPLDAPAWLKALLQNSRPLFAQLVSSRIQHSFCDLDDVLREVFMELILVKDIFGNYFGQLGQLRMFQNAHYSLNDWSSQSTPLIHSHFAQLAGTDKNFILMNNGRIKESREFWKPCSVFPKVQDDTLLYLLLMGGKDYSAFYTSEHNEVPYAHFLMNVKDDLGCRSHILNFSNAVQKTKDGMFLESLLCSTVCLASHSNGIQGICLKDFLTNLVYQVQMDKIDRAQVSIAGLEQLDQMNITIPFLSPPNQDWPSVLNIPNSNFGALSRTRNSEKIDLWVSSGFAAESKGYGSEIELETMRQILKRVPGQAKVELVFTRKLQKSYFNPPEPAFEDQFPSSHLLKKSYYKVNASSPDTSLEPIKGLPCDEKSTGGYVIFFEVNEKLIQ
jgi:hypothetical protein